MIAPGVRQSILRGSTQKPPWTYQGCVGAWHYNSVVESGGLVTQWNDLSGNNNHLVQTNVARQGTKTALGVQPAREYNLTTPITLDFRAHTVIAIMRPSDTTVSNSGALYQIPSGPGVYFECINSFHYWPNTVSSPLALSPSGVSSYVVSSGSSGASVYTSGAKASRAAFTAGSGSLQWLFGLSSDGSLGIRFPVVAFLIFNRQLSDTEISNIEKYFKVAQDVGGLHIRAEGDSITNGQIVTAAPNAYLRAAAATLGARFNCVGVNGRTLATIVSSSLQGNMVAAPSRTNVWVVFAGTNDVAANANDTSVTGNITTYCSRIKGANPNAKIILCTMLPRNAQFSNGQNAAGFDATRLSINTWIRANVGSIADGLADFAANAAFDTLSDADNTTYFNSDKVHPNNTGHALLAQILTSAVQALP